jgi:hypothetical protein
MQINKSKRKTNEQGPCTGKLKNQTFTKHNKHFREMLIVVVRLPGFEPECSAWEADVLPN